VLFEMLSGRRAFEGDTISDTIARVLEREPHWDALPRNTPSTVRTLLRRCLRKDPQKRLHDIADAMLDLDDASVTPQGAVDADAGSARGRSSRAVLPWLVALALGGALAWVGWRDYRASRASTAPAASPADPVQLNIHSAEGGSNSTFALSPDGRYLAFVPILTGRPMLWLYTIATGQTREIAGTEGARQSFWKFDSQEIAFFAGDQLKTVSLRGGLPVKIATVHPNVAGGTWGRTDVIVVTKLEDALQRVGPGGTFEAVTALRKGESLHAAPAFLPDGVHFLYVAVSDDGKSRELRIGSLESKEMSESLGPVESNAVYADGYLFVVRGGHAGGGSLTVRPFDPVRRQPTGDAVALGLPAAVYAQVPGGAFSVSDAGRLVYLPTTVLQFDLTWHNRAGDRMGTVGQPGRYHHLDISPDDQKVAFSRQVQDPGKPMEIDIWTIDLKPGGGANRLTRSPAYEVDPAFSGDSRMLAFNSNQPDPFAGKWRLWIRPSDGSGKEIPVAEPVRVIASPDWSLDGKHIVYEDDRDLWTVTAFGGAKPTNVTKTPEDEEGDPAFSRDGRWVAYTSDKSGRPEVYVQAFSGPQTAHAVSRGGGWAPRWSGDGKELFFLSLDSMVMAASIEPATGMTIGVPRTLFQTGLRRGWQKRPYDVTTDGQRFLVPTMRPPEPFRVVLNWRALLEK
jgi:Tol biopolymer transport system component